MRLLVVEDNCRFGQLVREHLVDAGYTVDWAETAEDCRLLSRTVAYDLYLIDLGLPDGDGISLISELRAYKRGVPIMIITARAAVDDRINGLDAGADDYLIKPFNHRELLARIRALMRRPPVPEPDWYKTGNVVFYPKAGDLRCGSRPVELRPSERRLLALLIRHASHTVTRAMIENHMKSIQDDWSPNAIDKLVSRLRKALETQDTGLRLKTVRGIGYMLEELGP